MAQTTLVVGMDEVGRGSWAGPLFVGAVVLGPRINGLRDSKLLTREQRQRLDRRIRLKALAYSLGQATHLEIDELGMTAALGLAYQRALTGIDLEYEQIVIDGSVNYLPGNAKAHPLVQADQLLAAVSAASIIAKVARDQLMADLARQYPGYGFESHVGYGTQRHAESLRALGVCEIHRRSFAPVKHVIERSV